VDRHGFQRPGFELNSDLGQPTTICGFDGTSTTKMPLGASGRPWGCPVISLAPIFELQIGYAAEVTKVSSDNGCTLLKGDGSDAKVVLADVQLHPR
jgi:hypothetical protein